MFCPECGTKIDEPMNFCPECGTNLIGLFAEMEAEAAANKPQETPSAPAAQQPSAPAQPAQPAQPNKVETVHADLPAAQPEAQPEAQSEPEEELPDIVSRGFIFTNLTTLSARLRTSVEMLQDVFQQFIKAKRHFGVSYQLVNAGDYEYHEHGFFSGRKRVKLDKSSPWYEYADILLDMHKAEKKAKQPESEYLFIVGGSEIVPMPRLPHWDRNNPKGHDKDFDTDILYSYPYGPEMADNLLNMKLFTYDALFYVGRLPLVSGDEGRQDLINYFNRDIENSTGIVVKSAYVQADPNWQGVTTKSIMPLIEKLQFARYENNPPRGGYAYDRVILSPVITLHAQEEKYHTYTWFNPYAQFVFINMHGSDAQKYPYYGGNLLHQDDFFWGMSPELFANMKYPNIVFAQPCYGGRFIGYDKDHSTLLTALSNQTLIFIGSSRCSWGCVDPDGDFSLDQLSLGFSDVTALVFNDRILQGYTAGQSFFTALCETFRLQGYHWKIALTISEFNLYGDPTLCCAVSGEKSAKPASKAAIIKESDVVSVASIDTMMQKSADKPQSMLQQLRDQVNKNIMDMSASIGKHLYEQYGIPKREPFLVQKVKYTNGEEELHFHYEISESGEVPSEVVVESNTQGDVKNVLQSK